MARTFANLIPPTDATQAEKQAYARFNKESINAVNAMLSADKSARRWRLTVITILAVCIVGGSFYCVYLITQSKDIATAIVGGGVVLGVLAVAGWVNPLQTIERDIIIRRWSDAIAASFALRLADDGTNAKTISAASRLASAQFAVLAASYGALSGDALAAITAIASKPADSSESDDEEPTQITLTVPASQTSTVGAEIESFTVEAKGPGTLTYAYKPAIDGVTLDKDGTFSGTPGAAVAPQDYEITVTVTSDSGGTATGTFVWTIKPKV